MATLLSTTVNGTINSTGYTTAAGFTGNANVAGTGAATYHPSGIYSTGTNWLYGTMYLNGNDVYDINGIRAFYFYDRADTSYYTRPSSTSRVYHIHADHLSIGQGINTSYRVITNGDYYANGGGNFWAEGRFKQYRGSGTWHDVIDSGNIGSQSVNYASSAGSASSITGGIPSGSDHYINLRVIRNANASPADGMYIGYGNAGSGLTRLYGGGSTGNHAYVDVNGDIWRSSGGHQYVYNTGTWGINISGTAARATRANGNFYIDDNYGNTVVGVYTSTRLQGVFAMGDSYKLPADGSSSGSLYGMAWSHPNAGGVASNLNTHGLLVMENGTFLAAISGSIRARDDMRAPALYDSGSRVAISRGEGRNYVDYSRYVYNNGAYSGVGWTEPSDLGVRYANSAGNSDTVDGLHASSFTRNDTTGQYLKPYYEYGSALSTERPVDLVNQMGGGGLRVDFMNPSYTGSGNWNHVITFSGYNGYNMYQLGANYDGGTGTALWVRSEANHGRTSWTSWRRLLDTSSEPYAANMNQYVRTSDSPSFSTVYVSNWFRTYGYTGLYSQDYGSHIRPTANATHGTWEIFGYNKNGYAGLNIQDASGYYNNYMHENGNGGLYQQNGSGWVFYWYRPNGCLGLGTSSTSGSYRVYVGGSLYAEGDIVAYSDARKKSDIVTIDNALDKVLQLRGVYYTRIDETEKGRQTGVIAQEINEVLPEAVTYAPDIDEYGVKYGNIAGVLIEAIKEQQKQIADLKAEIKKLKGE